ncbi:MAG: hypothetical protein V4732_07605 [Pseudomonadota bacterium]
MAIDRKLVVPLIEKYLPKSGSLVTSGTIGMDHICKDWTGGGTTCGFLPHWLLWRLGCKDKVVINRYEPDTVFEYKDQVNLGRFLSHKQFTRVAFPDTGYGANAKGPNDEKLLNLQISPKAGDAVIIQGNKSPKGNDTSHIFVVLDDGIWDSTVKGKGTWRVAETGQGIGGGSGHIAKRGIEFKGGRWWVNAEGKAADRWMVGWFDISNLEFGAPLKNHEYLTSFVADSVKASVSNLIGRWEITSSNGEKWIYFFYKGFRCFFASADTPGQFIGGGHWHPRGLGYNIHWDLYESETITNVTSTKASGTDSFGAWTGKKTPIGQMMKFKSNLGVR